MITNEIQLILTIAIPIYSLVVILLGVWLGHKVTMRAFSHVQPSAKEMTKIMEQGSVTQEPDWFDESMKDQPDELSNEEEDKLREEFKKTGLPMELFDSYQKDGRHPQEFFGYDVPYNQQGVEEELDKEAA